MEKPTAEIMSKKIQTVSHKTKMVDAYAQMHAKRFRHLPVTDDVGNIIGLLSDRDVQRAMRSEKGASGVEMKAEFDPTHLVKDFMSFPVLTVDQTVTVDQVASRMLNEKVSAFLVVDRSRPVGIVTTDDMLKLLIELLKKDPSSLRRTLEGFVQVWDPIY